MRDHHRFACLLLASTVLAAAVRAQQPATAAPPAGTAQESTEDAGDIIVTAQRRAENLQDTPIAITALNPAKLESRLIENTFDVAKTVPNLVILPVTASRSTVQLSLRGGTEQSGGLVVSEPPVAIYVDDVYRARLAGSNLEFNDIERIEVLRGPQGTLYGRNAFSGAIKVISRSPLAGSWANALAQYGRFDEIKVGASAGGRVAGNVGASLSALYRERDGYIRNIALNRDVGAEKNFAVRGKLEIEATDAITATGILSYTRDRNDGAANLIPIASRVPFPTRAANFITTDQLNFLAGGRYVTQTPVDSFGRTDQLAASLDVKADLGGATLRSITGYIDTDDGFRFDLTGGRRTAAGAFVVGTLDRTSDAKSKQFTQELLLLGEAFDDRLDYTAGLFYFQEKSSQTLRDFVSFSFPQTLLPTTLGTRAKSYAAFVQGTFKVSDQLSLTAGIRYTKDKKRLRSTIQTALNFNPVPPFPPQTLTAVDLDPSFRSWTPKFGIDFKATPDLLLYVSASRGFKAGGFNGLAIGAPAVLRTVYGPQTVWAYEAGAKLTALDRRLTANLSVFRNEFKGLQQTQQIGPGSFANLNVGTGRLDGIELELAANPLRGLDLYFNLALNDDKYKRLNPLSTAAISGATRFPLTSKVSYQTGASYNSDVIGDFASLRLSANYNWRGNYFAVVDNLLRTKPYGLLDASIGLVSPDKHWSLTLGGRNLANKIYFTTAATQDGIAVGEPVTWQLTLRYDM